jgi:hypothetical protein
MAMKQQSLWPEDVPPKRRSKRLFVRTPEALRELLDHLARPSRLLPFVRPTCLPTLPGYQVTIHVGADSDERLYQLDSECELDYAALAAVLVPQLHHEHTRLAWRQFEEALSAKARGTPLWPRHPHDTR